MKEKTSTEKKIIIISFSMGNNGAERVFCELANEWARQGIWVLLVQFLEKAYGCDSFVVDNRVKQVVLSKYNESRKIRKYFGYAQEIRHIVKQNPTAVVIAYSFITQFIVTISTFLLRNKIIFSERNDPNYCPYDKLSRLVRTISFFRADKCVFQTEDARRYFPAPVQNKGVIIPNPIKKELPGLCKNKRRKAIVTAARLRPQKNISLLIDAFSIIHKDYPDYSLEIFGIGEEKGKLEEQVRNLNIKDNVFFRGYQNNVDQIINDAAIYVCSSDYEGIPNSLLEAVSMGIPSVSTDCPIGGVSQIIQHEYNGLLVPVNDVTAMSFAIKRLIEDEILYTKISNNGYKLRDTYDVSRISKEWIKLF